jgi:signal transduction histidine kinase
MDTPLAISILFVLASGGTVFCVAAVVTRRRSAPGSDEFSLVAIVAGTGALAVAVGFLWRTGITVLAAVVVSLSLPVPWLMFALEYTGRDDLNSRRPITLITTPVVLGLIATALLFGSRILPGASLPARTTATGLTTVLVYSITTTQWIALLYAGGLMLVGTGLLLWSFHRYNHLSDTAGMLLGALGSIPWLSILFGLQVDSIAPLAMPATVAIGFLVGAVAVAAMLSREQLFDTVPAAGNIGPDTVIKELTDIIVVVDSDGSVVRHNQAAQQLPTSDLLGKGVDATELLDNDIPTLQRSDVVALRSNDRRRLFEPTVSTLTDHHGFQIGHAVVLRDVTERTIRRQRLEVLNRVLRHNIRNDTTVIQGRASVLADEVSDPALAEHAETIRENSEDLSTLSETARRIERLLSTENTDSRDVSLAAVVDDVLSDVPNRVVSECSVPASISVRASHEPLEALVTAVVENAIKHDNSDEPSVAIRARYDPDGPYPVVLTVTDTGPGISRTEREAVLNADEQPLRHGTGLGLWLVRWVTTRLGGELDIADNQPTGTVVSVYLPGEKQG